ncbi:hypothetical protein [Pseudobacteriovorax antillogorgiicola]|uniref:Outer membrane protein beta-barrel domain-containing protein n=1 Tax=Pseudobacteriovorax antillogorgiicola TaxID=1513793 RepID=A0A1Y6BZR3_9BACT|nr:hypothetical protein [Pseudobacteriovorax antillogorgiicola]TCS50286.1 hypothetical protein EDD56_113104 [Pseudobacteriovorax antillogorgiicola]SMF33865.1 hypothetical protein SAMN06296036_110103 [Pseudobacteriovorax antillogorgiicola]
MRIFAILALFWMTPVFGAIGIELQSGLGLGTSNLDSIDRTSSMGGAIHYSVFSQDRIHLAPYLSIQSDLISIYGNDGAQKSLTRLEHLSLGLGLRVDYQWLPELSVTGTLGALAAQGDLDVNRSLPNTTQIARLRGLEGSGYVIGLAASTPLTQSVRLQVGFTIQQLAFGLPGAFRYDETSAVDSGLSLNSRASSPGDFNLPAELKTSYQTVTFGLVMGF